MPYGCLVPHDLDGLLVGGRHISCDANSHGFMREIPQCWLTGQAAGVGAALRGSPGFFVDSFAVEEFDPEAELTIGDFTLAFQRTTHDEPTWACAVQGSRRLVYTADTRESADLEAFAKGADLLLCEATYPALAAMAGELPSHNHLTSRQAGELARRASVGELMLTHFWPGLDRAPFAHEAEAAFGAPVTLARPGLAVPIPGRLARAARAHC